MTLKFHRIVILAAALLLSLNAFAQNAPVDSTMLGADVLTPINQSLEIRNALSRHIVANSNKKMQGYRVRIFFGNDRTARAKSESIAAAFSERYPNIRVYRSHVSPYFKVTVGDFRTHADAQRFATRLTNSGAYQTAFVVKEQINYPGF